MPVQAFPPATTDSATATSKKRKVNGGQTKSAKRRKRKYRFNSRSKSWHPEFDLDKHVEPLPTPPLPQPRLMLSDQQQTQRPSQPVSASIHAADTDNFAGVPTTAAPWHFLQHVAQLPWYCGQITQIIGLPALPALRRAPRAVLHRTLHAMLETQLGFSMSQVRPPATARHQPVCNVGACLQLFSHQAEAIDHIIQGKHVVLATATSSGKSLAYHLPVLHFLLTGSSRRCHQPTDATARPRALYLFPTKALAQDQLRSLGHLLRADGLRHLQAFTYDGDTASADRPTALQQGDVLLANPDILHVTMLPRHRSRELRDLFANLRVVVVDEAHVYTGSFGAHVAAVLARLRRICSIYGNTPQFVCCSATIGNPGPLAAALIGGWCLHGMNRTVLHAFTHPFWLSGRGRCHGGGSGWLSPRRKVVCSVEPTLCTKITVTKPSPCYQLGYVSSALCATS